MAFHLESGKVAWKSQDFGPTFSSPILIDVDGQDQLVVFESTHIVGLAPASGELLWKHPHPTQYNINATTPVWGPDNYLYVSSAYDAGSRVVHLARADGNTKVEEAWYDGAMQIHHGTAVRHGDMIYGSSGDFGPAFLMGAHASTGKMTAKQRGFAKANLLGVGEHLILLDEDGVLAILRPGPENFEVLAQAQVFSTRAWTVPTLVGTTLYARDRKEIVALDLTPR